MIFDTPTTIWNFGYILIEIINMVNMEGGI